MIRYTSQNQLRLTGFKTPFEENLLPSNRWVVLAEVLPWDDLAQVYHRQLSPIMGRGSLNTRLVIGVLIIKHMLKLDDREVLATLQENIYLQYFVGFSSFQTKIAFDPSLLVTIRKRMGLIEFDAWSESVIKKIEAIEKATEELDNKANKDAIEKESSVDLGIKEEDIDIANTNKEDTIKVIEDVKKELTEDFSNKIEKEKISLPITTKQDLDTINTAISPNEILIIDTTVAEQKIKYPTDLDLLNKVRETTESLIDTLYAQSTFTTKPRTYREIGRKEYLRASMKRKKSAKEVRKAIKKQLGFVERNIRTINVLWEDIEAMIFGNEENERDLIRTAIFKIVFKTISYKTWLVCQEVCRQQKEMIEKKVKSIPDRIVSIHQPHVRPILRGKAHKNIEFGSKVALSVVNRTNRIFKVSWDAYNDGVDLIGQVEAFKKQYGKYPKLVLADKIYMTKANRAYLKQHNIQHRGQPLGRPKKDKQGQKINPYTSTQIKQSHQRNHVEGQFGTAKDAYSLSKVKAKLPQTSESWIANIFFILNVIRLLKVAQIAMGKHFFALFSKTKIWLFFAKNTYFSLVHSTIKLDY